MLRLWGGVHGAAVSPWAVEHRYGRDLRERAKKKVTGPDSWYSVL